MQNNLKTLSPDLYLRYYSIFNIIKSSQKNLACIILDVGGRAGILGDLIKQEKLPYKLEVLDVLKDTSDKKTTCDLYIRGNIKQLKNKKYDYVISLDTLEHVKEKNKFLNDLTGLAPTLILCAPFYSKEIVDAEKNLNNYYKNFTQKNHLWLNEHLKFGLPNREDLYKLAKKNKLFIEESGSNSINNWLAFMRPNLLPAMTPIDNKIVSEINVFYNEHYQELGDLQGDCYRRVFILSQNKIALNTKLVDIDINIKNKWLEMLTIFYTDIINLKDKELSNNKERYDKELKKWQEHANNLNTTLNKVTNSKFFKLWQAGKKIKRNPVLAIKLFTTGEILSKLRKVLANDNTELMLNKINQQYKKYLINNSLSKKEIDEQVISHTKFLYKPMISIILPVFNADAQYLEACIESVLNQTYKNWQLCIADDASSKKETVNVLNKYKKPDSRINIVFRKSNGNISLASNSAIKIATGEYLAFLDQDDLLTPDALFENVKVINQLNAQLDLIYSDEDKIENNGERVEPFFKPDWSPDLLMSFNYFTHLTVIRKSLVDEVKGFRKGYEGSQDYDLFLRITEKTQKIAHIQKVLYSWRKTPCSTAQCYDAKPYADKSSIKALEDSLLRRNIQGNIESGLVKGTFRTKYEISNKPLVSIIIPTKNNAKLLKKCIDSISKSTYKNYEVVIIDTGSSEKEAIKLLKQYDNNSKIMVIDWKKPFNYSAVNNFAANKAKGEYLLFLNNDTEVISKDWIEAMLEQAQKDTTGAVGAKLLYPDNTIQHAGVILGIRGGNIKKGVAGHFLKRQKDNPTGLAIGNLKDVVRNCSAVTAACLMVNKNKFFAVGGFDEKLVIAFNDVDFNLKLLKKGFFNVFTPFAKLYHYESVSVGTPEKGSRDLKQFSFEIKTMLDRWGSVLENDRFYNKNLGLENENCDLMVTYIL